MAKEVETKYSYQYDATARVRVEAAEPARVPSSPSPTRRPNSRKKQKTDVAFGLQISACVFMVFMSSFLYINRYAVLRTKQRELNNLKNEKIAIANEITKINADMSKKLDLDYIRQRATTELGMRKPLAHQIVYIQLPEQSYTTYN